MDRTSNWIKAAEFILFAAVSVALISLNMPQYVTGILINFMLLAYAERAGSQNAVFLGMITPIAAALSGVLPAALLLMIPFIAISNGVFVTLYSHLKSKGITFSVAAAALVKFCILFLAVNVFVLRPVSLIIGKNIQPVIMPVQIANMMAWPQLATSLLGGLLFIIVISAAGKFAKH
jgi:hypothetical protein